MTDDNKTPFFARYLEGQDLPEVQTDVKAGGLGGVPWPPVFQTQKWPSDGDDDGFVVPIG